MAHHNTVFAQFLKLVPRHEFESLAKGHHEGRTLRVMTRWSQFVALATAQLTGRQSLRDVVSNLGVQGNKLYHLGCAKVTRSSLARVNEGQPYTLYEALFAKLYAPRPVSCTRTPVSLQEQALLAGQLAHRSVA